MIDVHSLTLYARLWTKLRVLVARHVFKTTHELQTQETGSGDGTIDHVGLFIIAVVATLGTIVWTALDRRRSDERLQEWLRVLVRYSLGVIMFGNASEASWPARSSRPSSSAMTC
jgi:hypothetical protein